MSRELLKLKNIGKLVPNHIVIAENTDGNNHDRNDPAILPCFPRARNRHAGSWPKPVQRKQIHTPAILDDFIPDHDRTKTDSRQKTLLTDRLSSMSRFVSHQGIWRFQFQAFFGTKENWNCCEEVCSKKLLKRILFCTHWIKTLQVRGVDQTPCPIVYCMELRWRQPCSDE